MREKFSGILFYDKLLELGGVDANAYPPCDPNELENLFHSILDTPNPSLTLKNCLLYYIMKDFGTGIAEKYASTFDLSRPFKLAIDGFWAMDNGKFKEAIQFLSDPSVDLDDSPETCLEWPRKIIESLFASKALKEGFQFVQSTKPALWSQSAISGVLQVLVSNSILSALEFCRQFCKHDIQESLNLVFSQVFSNTKGIMS